jgi:hypothetical protein
VRAASAQTLAAPAARVDLGDGVTLVKPSGVQGQVAVATWGQATRGVDGDPLLKPPPGLEGAPHLFQPLGRAGTRGVGPSGPSGLVISLDLDEESRRRITPDNPLRLELPPAPGDAAGAVAAGVADLLPVIFDGEDYLLAGYAGDRPNTVDVVTVPPPVILAAVPAGPQGLPSTRGIGRTLKLFIYRKIGRHTTLTGLRSAAPGDVDPTYAGVQRDQFRAGQRVALFVHGLNSDTGWMIQGIAQHLLSAGIAYDHLLTWDYESFGTGLGDTGEALAEALRQQCGFGPNDGITLDVFAHSMGCLVSRCMVELSGGDAFVDRVVLAGPPNRGSTLATAGRGLVFLTTVLLNRYSIVPPVGAINWLAKNLYQQGVGIADLAVDSPLAKRLNALDKPDNVPYLVLAGENVQDEAQRSRVDRLAKKVLDRGLDALFGEQNDVAIGLSSLEQVRGGSYPRLTVRDLPCDHFSYFSIQEGLQAVDQWLTAQT